MTFVWAFLLAFAVTVAAVPLVRILSVWAGAVDMPNHRKIHSRPLPRLGGIAIMAGFVIPFLLLFPLDRAFLGLLAGAALVFAIGLIDDIRGLGPWTKLAGQVIASGLVLAGGIGVISVANPLAEGVIALDQWRIPMAIGGFEFNVIPVANAVSILWLVGLMNTINFLDGMDGLAAGVVAITAIVIALVAGLSLAPSIEGIAVVVLASILAGACCGFLVFNWHPSSIIMGDSGAYLLGIILAVIAMYGGAKIGVGLLVLGVAVVDTAWAAARRLYRGQPIFTPDRGHIHHQLLDSGLSQVQVVTYLYIVAAAIGLAAITGGVWAALIVLALAMVVTMSLVRIRQRA